MGWKYESRRHALASKGIKTAMPKEKAMNKVPDVSPYDFQNSHQEKSIHSPYWHRGNSYRYVLEGTGDVFRELTKKDYHSSYIEEKLRRIENHFENHDAQHNWSDEDVKYYLKTTGVNARKTKIHPEDSYEFSYKHNKEIYKKMISDWEKQPYDTAVQKEAIALNLNMLKKDYASAKINIKTIRGSL